ncbi:hypothetical protein Hanom_Chr01g00053681 [Helianthus anomalus]
MCDSCYQTSHKLLISPEPACSLQLQNRQNSPVKKTITHYCSASIIRLTKKMKLEPEKANCFQI